MKFLTKLGSVLARIIGIATGFAPLIDPYLPKPAQAEVAKVVDKLQGIANAVINVEQVSAAMGLQKNGSQKLTAAVPFVSQIIQSMELIAGKKPTNEPLFIEGVQDMTSGMAKVLNAFEE